MRFSTFEMNKVNCIVIKIFHTESCIDVWNNFSLKKNTTYSRKNAKFHCCYMLIFKKLLRFKSNKLIKSAMHLWFRHTLWTILSSCFSKEVWLRYSAILFSAYLSLSCNVFTSTKSSCFKIQTITDLRKCLLQSKKKKKLLNVDKSSIMFIHVILVIPFHLW